MRTNKLKEIWKRDGAAVNGWLSIPSAFSAEVMAHQGFDSLTIDLQHGIVDYQVAVTMLQAISTTSVVPMVRVPWNDPAVIMKALDAGAYGVICPMVNTAEQAASLVHACRYPPQGMRSWGPTRATLYAGSDYGAAANDEIIVMPMIETAEALANLDSILDVPGVDAIYVGPADLCLSLGGKASLDHSDSRMLAVQLKIAEACKRHNVVAGIHNATASYAVKMVAAGYQFATVGSDGRFLANKANEELAQFRKDVVGLVPAY